MQVIALQEDADGALLHDGTFGERERFTHEATQALMQGIVETLMMRVATAIGGVMALGRQTLW